MADTGSIQLISLKECYTIVKNALNLNLNDSIDIESYAVEPGSKDLVGFMGEYFKLKVILGRKVSVTRDSIIQKAYLTFVNLVFH